MYYVQRKVLETGQPQVCAWLGPTPVWMIGMLGSRVGERGRRGNGIGCAVAASQACPQSLTWGGTERKDDITLENVVSKYSRGDWLVSKEPLRMQYS